MVMLLIMFYNDCNANKQQQQQQQLQQQQQKVTSVQLSQFY